MCMEWIYGRSDFILFFLIINIFIMKFTFQNGHFRDQITHLFTSFLRHRPPLMRLFFVGVLLWGHY